MENQQAGAKARWSRREGSSQYEAVSDEVRLTLVCKVKTANPIRSFKGRGTDYFLHGPTSTTEGSGSIWVCSAPAGERSATYELTILGEGPLRVLWVVAKPPSRLA